jgi:hypothetical protein
MRIDDLTSSPLRESRRLLRIAHHRTTRWFRPSIAIARHHPQRATRRTRSLAAVPRAVS